MKKRPRFVDWLLDFVNRLLPVVTGIAITFTVQGMVNRAHTRRDVRSALQLVRTELVSNREDVAVLGIHLLTPHKLIVPSIGVEVFQRAEWYIQRAMLTIAVSCILTREQPYFAGIHNDR